MAFTDPRRGTIVAMLLCFFLLLPSSTVLSASTDDDDDDDDTPSATTVPVRKHPPAKRSTPDVVDVPLSLLFTTDVYGRYGQFSCRERDDDDPPKDIANLLQELTSIRQKRKQASLPPPLLFNTGDHFFPSYSARFLLDYPGATGRHFIADTTLKLGYDLIGLGNQDLSILKRSLLPLLRRMRKGKQAFALSNLKANKTHPLGKLLNRDSANKKREYFVFERTYKGKTIRVGVIHLVPETMRVSRSGLKGLSFSDPIERAKALVEKMKEDEDDEKIDLFVALSHLEDNDGSGSQIKKLAEKVKDLDVILTNGFFDDAEQMKTMTYTRPSGKKVIFAGGVRYGGMLGEIKLLLRKEDEDEKATLISSSIEGIPLKAKRFHKPLRAQLKKWEKSYCSMWGKPLGTGKIRAKEEMSFEQFTTYLLNLMRIETGAELGVLNVKALEKGDFPLKKYISRDDLYRAMPFNFRVYVLHVQGRDLEKLLKGKEQEKLVYAGWDGEKANGREPDAHKYYSIVATGGMINRRLRDLKRELDEVKAKVTKAKKAFHALLKKRQKSKRAFRKSRRKRKQARRRLNRARIQQSLAQADHSRSNNTRSQASLQKAEAQYKKAKETFQKAKKTYKKKRKAYQSALNEYWRDIGKKRTSLALARKKYKAQKAQFSRFKNHLKRQTYKGCKPTKTSTCAYRLRARMVQHFQQDLYKTLPAAVAPPKPEKDDDDDDDDDDDGDKKKKTKPFKPFGPKEIPYTGTFVAMKRNVVYSFDLTFRTHFDSDFISPINLDNYGDIPPGYFNQYVIVGELKLRFSIASWQHSWLNTLSLNYGAYFSSAWIREPAPGRTLSILDERNDLIQFNTAYKYTGVSWVNPLVAFELITEFTRRDRVNLADEEYIRQIRKYRYRRLFMKANAGVEFKLWKLVIPIMASYEKEETPELFPALGSALAKELDLTGLPDPDHRVGFEVGILLEEYEFTRLNGRTVTLTSTATYSLNVNIILPNSANPNKLTLLIQNLEIVNKVQFELIENLYFDLGFKFVAYRGTVQRAPDEPGQEVDENLRVWGPWAFWFAPTAALTFKWGARALSL